MQDHPRLRGEHLWKTISNAIVNGSPPLTRGTRYSQNIDGYGVRITPAYAGNTHKQHLQWYFYAGSPPLTRGTLRVNCLKICCFGITPAYAGNTVPEFGHTLYV